eukprot:4853160-Amphidinium_carterae.1
MPFHIYMLYFGFFKLHFLGFHLELFQTYLTWGLFIKQFVEGSNDLKCTLLGLSVTPSRVVLAAMLETSAQHGLRSSTRRRSGSN